MRWLRPYDILLLLEHPLVIKADAIQEVPMQDDHLAVVEEEEGGGRRTRQS
jgi:hypothetical protein